MWGMDTVPSSHHSARGLSHSVSSNYPARALVGQNISYVEIRRRAGTTSLETMLLKRQLRWLGHVIRMPGNRLPRRILYSELSCDWRLVGGQKKRFKDHIKLSLSKCRNLFDRLEELAGDREEWRAVYDKGLTTFEQQHIDLAVSKRARRHQQRNQPPPMTTRQGSACTVCGRVCASAFRLRSHMRRHKETRWAASSSNRWTTKRNLGMVTPWKVDLGPKKAGHHWFTPKARRV